MIQAKETVINKDQKRVTVIINGSMVHLAIQLNAIIKQLASTEPGQVVIHSVFAHNIDKLIDSQNVFLKNEDEIFDLIWRLTEIDKNDTCN